MYVRKKLYILLYDVERDLLAIAKFLVVTEDECMILGWGTVPCVLEKHTPLFSCITHKTSTCLSKNADNTAAEMPNLSIWNMRVFSLSILG